MRFLARGRLLPIVALTLILIVGGGCRRSAPSEGESTAEPTVAPTTDVQASPPEETARTAPVEAAEVAAEETETEATPEIVTEDAEAETPVATAESAQDEPEAVAATQEESAPALTAETVDPLTRLHFADLTAPVLGEFIHSTPIVKGDGAQMISGAAAGDFDNDGWVDLYVIGGGNRADALYMNQQDGAFVDMAEAAGLAEPHLGSGAAVGDYDGDGWLDIFVTSFGPPHAMGPGQHLLFHNNGDGTFTDVAEAAGVNFASPELADGLGAAFGDYDLDGDLDLFVAGWRKPGNEPALGNRLFRNNGDGTFDDVTAEAQIVDDGIRGFNPCFVDMDGDRYPELLLAADFGTSRYFRNNGDGTFSDQTNASGTDKTWAGMGSAVGDVNNDGLPDWYITAIYGMNADGRGPGNTLYLNQGDHRFVEAAPALGVDAGGWAWGTDIVDFDNDGRNDIIGVNGWDLKGYVDVPLRFWWQQPDGNFVELSQSLGFRQGRNELGLLTLDYDNDGDRDVVITAYNDALRLYRTDLPGEDANWLRVTLDTSGVDGLAPNGFGSRVEVDAGEETFMRLQSACSHYLTQSDLVLHVGLGAAEQADQVRVNWPDGTTTTLDDVAANQTIVIRPEY